jgi:hypothetical protein
MRASWQVTFLILAIPGLLIAGIAALLVEPVRLQLPERKAARPAGASVSYKTNAKALVLHHIAVGLTGCIVSGLLPREIEVSFKTLVQGRSIFNRLLRLCA